VTDEHRDLGARVAGGDGLAVRPDAEHRVVSPRVELGHYRYSHQVPLGGRIAGEV
jgi:hypothetical protein